MTGSPALDAFVQELLALEATWTKILRGFQKVRQYIQDVDGQRAVDEMVAQYEQRLALMGHGHTIQVDALIADGYPAMEKRTIAADVYQELVDHIEDQVAALEQWIIEEVNVLQPRGVQATIEGEPV